VSSDVPFLGSVRDIVPISVLAVALGLGIAGSGPYVTSIILLGCGYLVAALGYNIAMGYSGQFVFGQAGFVAIGAYVYAVLQSRGVSDAAGFAIAIIGSGLVAAIVGLATVRTRGIYLALVTLAFAQATIAAIRLLPGTNGDDGLPALFFGNSSYPFVVIVVAALLVNQRLIRSTTGRAWLMVRSDEQAAAAMGVNGAFVRVLAFAISGMYGGASGVLLAGALGYITPDNFNVSLTLLLLTMIVVGGLGSTWGVVIGCAVITVLPVLLGVAQSYQDILFGLILFAVIVALPGGLIAFPQRSRHLRSVLTWIMSKMHRHPVGHQDGV
jgi:branched-chain amino acid transport system permease protein